MSEQFKVGDVVVLNKLNAVHHGQVGVVTEVNGERCRVKFADDEIHFNSEYLRRPYDKELEFWKEVLK